MLGWSLKLFRIRGIQLAVHASFFLLLAFAAQEGWQLDRWRGLALESGLLIAFFTCVVLHELGHSFTAMSYGIGVRRILLMPIGGMAEMDDIPRQPVRELLITLAGPAVNFVIAGVLWAVLFMAKIPDDVDPDYSWPAFVGALAAWNIRMGIFNLLPAFPMDGGRILRALLATRLPYLRATRWAATVGKIICGLIVLAVLTLRIAGYLGNEETIIYTALFSFIFYVGEREYRAVKHRELDDAHWRAVLARAYAANLPPPAEEPPLLTR